MNATFTELRTKSAQIIRALERNESITIFYRGKPKAVMTPLPARKYARVEDHPSFGMWADREDMKDPAAWVRRLRRRRRHAF